MNPSAAPHLDPASPIVSGHEMCPPFGHETCPLSPDSELTPGFRSLILLGNPGRGKTHLAIAMAFKAIIVTSNKEPATWGGVLHDPDLADAIVDRLLERGEIIHLKGKSYRNP